MDAPRTRLSAAVFDSRDPRALAGFYQRLLGWQVVMSEGPEPDDSPESGWVTIRSAPDATGLSFQYEPQFEAPSWPPTPGAQQMMMHLDVAVDDLATAVEFAENLGARQADHQPQDDVRVMLDPEGHPFCLFESAV